MDPEIFLLTVILARELRHSCRYGSGEDRDRSRVVWCCIFAWNGQNWQYPGVFVAHALALATNSSPCLFVLFGLQQRNTIA